MREVIVEVPRESVEEVLDQLLPIVPGGVREVQRDGCVELRMRGDRLPETSDLTRVLSRWAPRLEERTVPDDWRERRVADYEPDIIGGRVVVRPEWAPASLDQYLIEIVLGENAAFGAGTHPTTRTCVELLAELAPSGSFADLGCGTGLLAIAACRLGWDPVTAVDVQPHSVEATRKNAAANEVAVTVSARDLSGEPPPRADGVTANVPAWLHVKIAAGLPDPTPKLAIVSGFVPAEANDVLDAYAARGLRPARQIDAHGWVVAVLVHDLRVEPG